MRASSNWRLTVLLATPLIAGVLATFLSYDKVPFDMSDGRVAAEAKKYLVETANWPRKDKVPVIWNLVTEADNPKKGDGSVAPADPPSAPVCQPTPLPIAHVKDAHESRMKVVTDSFCRSNGKKFDAGPINIDETLVGKLQCGGRGPCIEVAQKWTGTTSTDDVYQLTVTSVEHCTPANGFDVGTPVANKKCSDILQNAWGKCEYFILSSLTAH